MENNKSMHGQLVCTIEISPVIIEEKTDLSNCHCCNDIIYGKMFRVWLSTKSRKFHFHGQSTDLVLCESCNDLVKNK